MEKSNRKVLKLGGDVLGVSIPKHYANFYEIKSSDPLEVTTGDREIIVKLLPRGKGDTS